MNNIEEFQKNLKIAYLNYENNDLKETLKYLDRMLETILKEDKSLEDDPFWKTLTCDVFKAMVLNNFYNKVELTRNDLNSLLGNEEELKKNIKEFCDNFRNNDMIDFIDRIKNITDNPLKEVIKILMSNIGKMNIADGKIETIDGKELKRNMIQRIDCFCGKTFEFDWSKIPNNDKFVYVRCPFCDSERKLKNMYFEEKNNNPKKSLGNDFLKLIDVLWEIKEFNMFNSLFHLSIAYVLDNLYDTDEYVQKYNQLFQLAQDKKFNEFSWEFTRICTDMVKKDKRTTKDDIDFYNKQLEIEEKIYKTGKLTLFGLKGIIKAEKYAPNWFFQLFHSYMPLKIQKIENTIINYLKANHSMSQERAKKSYDKLYKHLDLLNEYYHYINSKEFPSLYPKTVQLITAKQLYETERLSALGAYNYLIYLREKPEEALKDLNAGLKNSEHYIYNEPLKSYSFKLTSKDEYYGYIYLQYEFQNILNKYSLDNLEENVMRQICYFICNSSKIDLLQVELKSNDELGHSGISESIDYVYKGVKFKERFNDRKTFCKKDEFNYPYLTINIHFNYFNAEVHLHLENNIIRMSYSKEKQIDIMPLLWEAENKLYETNGYK